MNATHHTALISRASREIGLGTANKRASQNYR